MTHLRRNTNMRTALLIAALAAAPAWAWGPDGYNDAGCLVWNIDEVIDAGGLQQLPDGGLVGPGGVCIQLNESSAPFLGKTRWPEFDGGGVPPPPSAWHPVGI